MGHPFASSNSIDDEWDDTVEDAKKDNLDEDRRLSLAYLYSNYYLFIIPVKGNCGATKEQKYSLITGFNSIH